MHTTGKFGTDGMYTWLNVCIEEPKLACDLFPFLEGRGGGGSARPYPNKRTSCTRFFFCIPLGQTLIGADLPSIGMKSIETLFRNAVFQCLTGRRTNQGLIVGCSTQELGVQGHNSGSSSSSRAKGDSIQSVTFHKGGFSAVAGYALKLRRT